MFDQSVSRIDLRKLVLRFRYGIAIVVKNDGTGTGSALVDCEDVRRSVHTDKEGLRSLLHKGFQMTGCILLL